MLVPRRCASPYVIGRNARTCATGYLSPADLQLDGSTLYAEGLMYDSDLIDATGYDCAWFVILMTGAIDLVVDYEWHNLDPTSTVNTPGVFQLTYPYTNILTTGEGPFAFVWGSRSSFVGEPLWPDPGYSETVFMIGAFHMSFVFSSDVTFPTAWAFFGTTPRPPVGKPT